MASPLNSLRLIIPPNCGTSRLSPRLSPLSPAILSRSRLHHPGTQTNIVVRTPPCTHSRARRRLEYAFKSPKKTLNRDAQISVARETLVVNTPNKRDILKGGLGSLERLTILGRGTFGVVVKGSYRGEDVAIKVAKTTAATTRERNALRLRHANLVRTIDVIVKSDEHAIVVMEFLPDAIVLQSVIDDERVELRLAKIAAYASEIAAGLAYLHASNLLHLDLKPGNVLVAQDACKICDFGSSRMLPLDGSAPNAYEGTVQYTAPELHAGKPAHFSADVYSLGIVMWQLRYRENPYEAHRLLESRDAIIYNVVKHGLRPRAACREEVRDEYRALYQSCWSDDPDARPRLADVQRRLLRLL